MSEQEGKRVTELRTAFLGSSDVSSGGYGKLQPAVAPSPATPFPSKSKTVPQKVHFKQSSAVTALIGSDPITWSPNKTSSEPNTYEAPKQQAGSFDAGDPGYANQSRKNMQKLVILAGVAVIIYYVFINSK